MYHYKHMIEVNGEKVMEVQYRHQGAVLFTSYEDLDGHELVWDEENNLVGAQ